MFQLLKKREKRDITCRLMETRKEGGGSEPRSFRGRGTGNIRDGIVGGQRVYGGRNLRVSKQRKEWRTKDRKEKLECRA